ncbi:hypothetical protein BHE74_00006189 [Ensete ventricosum]|nr:hypothetical protein BHE74_00006189 [Ensete ventricosum]
MPQPLLDRGPSISFTHRGAVPTRREFADYDVDLSFNRVGRARLAISLRPPVWVVHSPLDIMTKVSLVDQVLDLVLQVPSLFNVMAVFTVERIVSAPVPFFGPGLDVVWWCQESIPPYLEEDLSPYGVERSRRGPLATEVWPLYPPPWWSRGGSSRLFHSGRFYSSCFPMIRASAAIKWFALCIISGTMEGCALGIAHDSVANLLMNCARGSSLPWVMPRSEAAVGLGRALARNPLKVVGKTRHISASDESYNAICAQMAATCSVGSELPSYDSKTGSLKLVGTGLSRISGAKGDLCLELSAVSSFDLVTSFWTSSKRSFMRQSCTRNELVESDDRVSWSYGGCSIPRWGLANFSRTIDGVSDQVSGGLGSIGPGRASARGSQDPS